MLNNIFEHYDFLSLNEVIKCAQKASESVNGDSADHHFQIIQMPANLLEHQFVSVANNQFEKQWYSVLERANQLKLDVLLNRPLYARYGEGFLHVARKDFDPKRNYKRDLQTLFKSLSDVESHILSNIRSTPDFERALKSFQNDSKLMLT